MTHSQFWHHVEISTLQEDKIIHYLIVLSVLLHFYQHNNPKYLKKYFKVSQEKISVFYCLFPKLYHQ